MNRKLKFNDPKQKVWVGSDFHIHHNRDFVWGKREFKSVEEHDRWILEDVNSLIGQEDILIYLGDGMLNARGDDDFEKFYGRIICNNIYWIFGNHSSPDFFYYKKNLNKFYYSVPDLDHSEIYPFKIDNITFLGNYAEIIVHHQHTTFSHFPLAVWNKSHHGTWSLSGHSHGSNIKTLPSYKHGKILDCGVEVAKNYWNHAVFSWDEIKKIMKNKEIEMVDHHNHETT